MKAVVFDPQAGGLRLDTDYAQPTPPPGEARIRTLLAGICNTDLEILRGYAQFEGVLGHEFVGRVVQAEDAGNEIHCPQRTTLGIHDRDGALAEFFCLPARNLHPIPENVPDETAVFTEPLAAACEILDQVHIRPTDRVVVLGDGKLGLLIAQVVALTGCDLMVVGRHQDKLDILARRGIVTQIGTHGLARKADLVVECTGRAEGFRTARELVRPRGWLVLKSTYHGRVETDLSSLVVDEIQVVGSRCGPFPAALRLLAQGLVDVQSLIEAEYSLDEAVAAFEHAGHRGSLKVLVRP